MSDFTQGTIISGIRSEKYPGTICNAIIISARCDLANCKVSQVYYVVAVAFDDWLLSDEGFSTVIAARVKEIANKIETQLKKANLDWDTLKTFSNADFEKVIRDKEVGLGKSAEQCMSDYLSYQKYQAKGLSNEEKRYILATEKNSVNKYLLSIANGQVMHYVYLPKAAYSKSQSLEDGFLVDLQELDRFDMKTAKVLADCNMDIQSKELSDEDKGKYNKQFFLKEDPGYAISEGNVESPWLEYLMQHFANSFIRIGVDGPQKPEISKMLDRVCKEAQE